MDTRKEIVLASGSPRRTAILDVLKIRHRVVTADKECPLPRRADPVKIARTSALGKAEAVAAGRDNIIVAADTVVADGLDLLGKPQTNEEASRYLKSLRGRQHMVVTALVLIDRGSPPCLAHCISKVTMRNYTDREIESYIHTGSPFDKAGAYGIQDAPFLPVENVKGCYLNVVGLPVCTLLHMLKKKGLYRNVNLREQMGKDCRECYARLVTGGLPE